MARLLRIERAITWIARTLVANRDANPTPEGVINQILPTIDTFGSQRAGEMQFATVIDNVGSIEVIHTLVDAGNVRQYLSMEWSHNDGGNHSLRPGRIITAPLGFPFAGFETEKTFGPLDFQAARNITVGPGQRLAVRADAMGGAARMTLTVLWIETPLGEYARSLD